MNINPSWKYNEVVDNLKLLRNQYQEILTTFFYVRDENKFIRDVKDKIYALKFDENKIDHIWEFMNNDLDPLSSYILFGIGDFDEEDTEFND